MLHRKNLITEMFYRKIRIREVHHRNGRIPDGGQVQPALKVAASEPEKFTSSFSLETEISKLKIPIPLTELCRSSMYRNQIMKFLQQKSVPDPISDVINLHDEKPTIVLGPRAESREDNTPPFYISLNIHNKVLHNCLLDSGASHNLMPKVVMDELGLDITSKYHDLFSLTQRKFTV